MGILDNKRHFLQEYLTYVESTGLEGKDGGIHRFLTSLGIRCTGDYFKEDHSTIDWNRVEPHFQFGFDYTEIDETELSSWLRQSEMGSSEFLFTWLDWHDPIIKIRSVDFISHWKEFYCASVDGLILTTPDGRSFLEFTDDWKYHINSNFQIKPGRATIEDFSSF